MLSPFLVSPPQSLHLIPSSASMKVLPLPTLHSHLTTQIFPFPGASSLHRIKSLPSH